MSRRLVYELALLLVAATLLTILILALAETADTVTLHGHKTRWHTAAGMLAAGNRGRCRHRSAGSVDE